MVADQLKAVPERFVILKHTPSETTSDIGADRRDREHLDWMFEGSSALETYATEVIDLSRFDRESSIQLAATKIADHRLDYLQYEGPISGDRGSVIRIAQGSYRMIQCSDQFKQKELNFRDGPNIVITLTLDHDDRWLIEITSGSGSRQDFRR